MDMGDVGCGVPKAAREDSGKKAGAGRAGLSEDPKIAAGYEAIFGKKPSGADPRSLGVSGSTQPEIFEVTVSSMRQAMRDNHEKFWRESVRDDGPVRILEVESLSNQRVLENGNHRFQAAIAENLPIPDWAYRVDPVKTWSGPTWPLDQTTRMPGLK